MLGFFGGIVSVFSSEERQEIVMDTTGTLHYRNTLLAQEQLAELIPIKNPSGFKLETVQEVMRSHLRGEEQKEFQFTVDKRLFHSPSLIPNHLKANVTFQITDANEVVVSSIYTSNNRNLWILCWVTMILCFLIGLFSSRRIYLQGEWKFKEILPAIFLIAMPALLFAYCFFLENGWLFACVNTILLVLMTFVVFRKEFWPDRLIESSAC